jgi:hypothetical protein
VAQVRAAQAEQSAGGPGVVRALARGHEQALAQGGTAGSAGARSGGAQASERGRSCGTRAALEQEPACVRALALGECGSWAGASVGASAAQ